HTFLRSVLGRTCTYAMRPTGVSAAQAATRRVPLKRQYTRQFGDKRRAALKDSLRSRVYPRTCDAAFRDTSGQANTSASPPAALARAIPTTSIAYTSHPTHIVCPGPSRSLAAPPRKLDDERTTCTAAHKSGTTDTGTPSSCERRMIRVSGMRRR